MSPDETSLTLLGRARADDPDAWRRLVFLYGPLVRAWAARRGVLGADAEDVEQEVFRAVAGGLAGFRRDRPGDSFRGWLNGITRNVLLSHHRRAGRHPRAGGGTAAREVLEAVPDPLDEPDTPADRSALYRRGLELVKGEFEARTWEMFWAHVVEGHRPDAVAADMGVSAAAVRQAKSRVLRRLREELGRTPRRAAGGLKSRPDARRILLSQPVRFTRCRLAHPDTRTGRPSCLPPAAPSPGPPSRSGPRRSAGRPHPPRAARFASG